MAENTQENEYVLKITADTRQLNENLDQADTKASKLKSSFNKVGDVANSIGDKLTKGFISAQNVWSSFASRLTDTSGLNAVVKAQNDAVTQMRELAAAESTAAQASRAANESIADIEKPLSKVRDLSAALSSTWKTLTLPSGATSKEAEQLRAKIIQINEAAKNESAKVEAQIKKIKYAMEEVGNTKIPTTAWKDHLKELETAKKRVEEIQNFMRSTLDFAKESAIRHGESAETGMQRTMNSPGYKNDEIKLQTALENYKAIEQKGQNLITLGKAFQDMTQSTRYQALNRDLEDAEGKLNDISETSYNQVMALEEELARVESSGRTQLQEIGSALLVSIGKNITDAFKSALSVVKKLGSYVLQAGKAVVTFGKNLFESVIKNNLFTKAVHAASNAVERFFRMLKTRLTRKFITTVFADLTENFKKLATINPEFNDALSRMTVAVKTLGAQIIAIVEPIIVKIEPFLTWVLDILTTIADKAAQFTARLFGNDEYTKATKGQYDYAESLDNSTESTKKLTNATNEYHSSVLGFDKLNRLSGGSKSSTSSASSDLAVELDKAETEKNELNELADKVKEAWENKDWAGFGKGLADLANYGIGKFKEWIDWKEHADEITEKVHNFTTALNNFVKNIDAKQLGEAIGSAVTTLVNIWNLLLDDPKKGGIDFEAIGKLLGETFIHAADSIPWADVGAALIKSVQAFVRMLNSFLSTSVKDETTGETKTIARVLGESLSEMIGGAIEALDPDEWSDLIANLVNSFADFIIGLFGDTERIGKLAEKLATTMNKVIQKIDSKKLSGAINALVKGFNTFIAEFLGHLNLGDLTTKISEIAGDLDWGEIGKAFGTLMAPSFLSGLWNTVKTTGGTLLKGWLMAKVAKWALGLGGAGAGAAGAAGAAAGTGTAIATGTGAAGAATGVAGASTGALAAATVGVAALDALIIWIDTKLANKVKDMAHNFADEIEGDYTGTKTLYGSFVSSFVPTKESDGSAEVKKDENKTDGYTKKTEEHTTDGYTPKGWLESIVTTVAASVKQADGANGEQTKALSDATSALKSTSQGLLTLSKFMPDTITVNVEMETERVAQKVNQFNAKKDKQQDATGMAGMYGWLVP